MAEKHYTVFISYAHDDSAIAGTVADRVDTTGALCLIDFRILPAGEQFMSTIREAIESSHEFTVLLSKWSMNRPWVLVELGMALSGTRRIVPILSGVGPERLLEIPYIHGFTAVRYEKLDGYIGELARRVFLWRSAPGQTPRTERHLDGLRDQIEFAIRQWRGG